MAERFFTQLKTPEEPVAEAPEVSSPTLVDSNIQEPSFAPADPSISLPVLKPTARPASAMATEPTQEGRQGFWNALMHGDDPNKEDGFGSIVGSSLTDFVRHGVDAGYELFDDQRQEVRKKIDEIRAYDPAQADIIEAEIGGKKRSTMQNVIRLTASLGEAALTIIPFFTGAKVLKGGAAASKVVPGFMARTLTKIPGMSESFAMHVATGFKYGAGFGGLSSLSREADFSDALRDASIGGALGMALPFAFKGVGKASGFVSGNTAKVFNKVGQVGFQFSKFLEQNPKTMRFYKAVAPLGGTIKTYYGDTGQAFVNMYNKANQVAQIEISDLAYGMVQNGLLKPPGVASKVFKGVTYIAEDQKLMTEANLALRGMGMYKDPAVRNAFLEKNPSIKFIDDRFKSYGVDAEHQGLLTESTKIKENYVPKYTPAIELKSNISNKVSAAGSQAEREALYASNNADVKWMVENSVFNEKAFKTLEEGYGVYYDWANFVAEGGRMGVNNNKFLQWMVKEGKAKTIEEAEGILIRQMQFRDSGSLTKKASSLDFTRDIDMPFYDVNPARVLSNYGNEVITRVNNSKVFGANDEIINELVSKVKNEKGLSQAQAFSELVDKAMKGSTSGRVAEDISAWIRGIQVFKIGFSTILQIPQNLNTLVSTDFKSFAYGIGQAFKEEGVQRALKDGALMNGFIREMHQQTAGSIGGTKIADKFLNMIGLTRLDSFNRVVASNAGELYAQREFAALLKNAGSGTKGFRSIASPEVKRLEELGINVKAAITRGFLNEEDLTLAGYAIAKETQFLGRPIDLPYFASSAFGKVIMQFRTFAYQQGTFLKQQIWDDLAGRGDFKRGIRNLTIFATIFPLSGEVVADIRAMLTNSKRPPIGFQRYIENILSAGGFGLAYDAMKSAGAGRLDKFILGAGISDAIGFVENAVKIPKDMGEGLLRQGINALPFGRAVTNRIWEPQGGKTFNEQIMDWLK